MGISLEDNVHGRGRLRDLPVDSGGGRGPRLVAEVDDEVADAPEEVVLVDFFTSWLGSAFHLPVEEGRTVVLRSTTAGDVGIGICTVVRYTEGRLVWQTYQSRPCQ